MFIVRLLFCFFFFFQAEDGIRDYKVTGVQTCALPISDKCVHELVEAQAKENPEALAVVQDGRQLTYEELNARANQLARLLRQKGVGGDVPVAICLKRSLEMPVALLAVLKAGGACVPLDS